MATTKPSWPDVTGPLAEYADGFRAELARLGYGRLGLDQLTAAEVRAFVLDRARKQPQSAKRVVTALRSLLRFLRVDGVITMPLAGAVPSPAGYSLAGLPRALEPGQVQAMLASRDPATATGRRDRAVLLLLSRMGLRAGELAGLGLHDIDWRRGEITVRGKGGRRDRLPLPADVGGASTITTEDALAWATLPAGTSPAWQAIWLAAVRGFAAYLHGTDPSVQVPRPD